jgi:hypothetical protein
MQRFAGPGSPGPALSSTQNRIRDHATDEIDQTPIDRWPQTWTLITVSDTAGHGRVLLEGNKRALGAHKAVQLGLLRPDERTPISEGELAQGLVFLAKAIFPLWL